MTCLRLEAKSWGLATRLDLPILTRDLTWDLFVLTRDLTRELNAKTRDLLVTCKTMAWSHLWHQQKRSSSNMLFIGIYVCLCLNKLSGTHSTIQTLFVHMILWSYLCKIQLFMWFYRNTVHLGVMSFSAPTLNFWCKWNAALVLFHHLLVDFEMWTLHLKLNASLQLIVEGRWLFY